MSVYKKVGLIITAVLSLGSTTSNHFSLPKLKCVLADGQFISEIRFRRDDNRFHKKGFLGELANYTLTPQGGRKLFSSVAFKEVIVSNQNLIEGLTGDVFSTTGKFSLINQTASRGITGRWKYTHTDLSGEVSSTDFNCYYSSTEPSKIYKR